MRKHGFETDSSEKINVILGAGIKESGEGERAAHIELFYYMQSHKSN